MTKNTEATKWYSDRQELAVARAIDGRRTPMSGASAFVKGDVVTRDWLIECKTQMAEKKSFSIKKDWIDKSREEAFATGKPHVAIAFNFGGEDQSKNYFIISQEDFVELVRHTQEG